LWGGAAASFPLIAHHPYIHGFFILRWQVIATEVIVAWVLVIVLRAIREVFLRKVFPQLIVCISHARLCCGLSILGLILVRLVGV
jgi:hypothetical protein